ncbi:putative ribose/galactose/methyl galactoside import ATP-binding protein 1 [Nymphon striatum]|nr:putative ribose/galactose/methyl galactoside import ATP-binding protein 1 [Nymphon striatum]
MGRAIEQAGKAGQITAIGFDGNADLQDMVKSGTLLATAVQGSFQMGELGVNAVADILAGNKVTDFIDTGVRASVCWRRHYLQWICSMLDMSPSSPPLVTMSNIHKRFGGVHAVEDVSITLNAGEVVGVLGHNGAGKVLFDAHLIWGHEAD